MRCTARLAFELLDVNAEFEAFQAALDDEGAVATFTGVARPESVSGGAVTGLFLEHHPRLTEISLGEIAEDAGRRFDASAITVVHRCGNIAPGETIVFVAAAALHRRAAFEAAEYAMDRLKTEGVFWKREDRVDGSRWIEPTVADQVDRTRWSSGMAGIDENRTFHPLRIAVLTISDTRTEESDTSGALLVSRLEEAGHQLAAKAIVADDIEAIRGTVRQWVADPGVDLIITTGGTGFTARDVTPEAVRPMFRRDMDGFSVLFHHASLGTVGVSTLQSRAFAGQIDDTFVFCLPGSTGACRDGWDHVLALELDSRYQPCSLAGQVPRLRSLCG